MAIDLAGVKTAFKNILDTANTTTAAYPLSTGMATTVQKVLKIDPAKIRPQASFFPFCTIYTDSKSVTLDSINTSQQIAKRTAEVSFNVVGAVWSPIITDITEDQGSEEIELLMENIEEIVRRNFKLSGTCLWTKPVSVSYGSVRFGTTDQARIGVMELQARIQY